jgi:hypothetical protein
MYTCFLLKQYMESIYNANSVQRYEGFGDLHTWYDSLFDIMVQPHHYSPPTLPNNSYDWLLP